MNVRRILTKECVIPELRASDKDAVIVELIDQLVTSGRLADREGALKAVRDREQRMSTGMQDGIAIPHGKTDVVLELMAAFGRKSGGVPFESQDGKPSQLFLLILSPVTRPVPSMQFLAEMSRVLHNEANRKELLSATEPEVIASILWGEKKS